MEPNAGKAARASDVFSRLDQNPEYLKAWKIQESSVTLAANVLRIRRVHRMTQDQLANKSGMKQPRIAEIERGDSNPTLETISKLAHALDVPVDSLLRKQSNLAGIDFAFCRIGSVMADLRPIERMTFPSDEGLLLSVCNYPVAPPIPGFEPELPSWDRLIPKAMAGSE